MENTNKINNIYNSSSDKYNNHNNKLKEAFQLKYILPYVLALGICITLCFGFERFLQSESFFNMSIVAKNISHDIINVEEQIDKRLIAGLHILETKYPSTGQLSSAEINTLLSYAGVDSMFLYNKEGIAIYSSTGALNKTKHKEYYSKLPHLFQRDTQYKSMIGKNNYFIIQPIRITPKGKYSPFKSAMTWSNKLNMFIGARIRDMNIRQILIHNIAINNHLLSIKIQTPSGHILTEASKASSDNSEVFGEKMPSVCNYITDPILSVVDGKRYVQISFGKENVNTQAMSHGLTCKDGKYFYTGLFEFSTTKLHRQIFLNRVLFCCITIFILWLIYYKQKLIYQANTLAQTSINLCNTRMGEIRRYVTKIVQDHMRKKNMRDNLPEDVLKIFDEAFDKFSTDNKNGQVMQIDKEVFKD